MSRRSIIIIILYFYAGFFVFDDINAKEPSLVINEILIGSIDSAKREFIELYNPTDKDIGLEGFVLKKKTKGGSESNLVSASKFFGVIKSREFFVISHPDFAEEFKSDLIYSGTSYSIANDNTIVLYDANEEIVDMLGCGEAGDYEGDRAPNPSVGESLERAELGLDTDNNFEDFKINLNPSPGEHEEEDILDLPDEEPAATSTAEELDNDETVDDEDNSEVKPVELYEYYNLGAILINEFVSDPSDQDTEWAELVNTTNEKIDLEGWEIVEGGGSATSLSGNIKPYSYLVINNLKGNLNNGGDIIELRDSRSVLIDTVTYGNWDDGNVDDNAPVASDPNSIARKIDAHTSYNNSNDFVITITLTKGRANSINLPEAEAEISLAEKAEYDYSDEIYISEVLPNPLGNDELEFIELYNFGKRDVSLAGWRLGDASTKRFELSGVIRAGEYFLVKRENSKIALNNGSDSVVLYLPLEDKASKEIKYEKAKEGYSFNCVYFEEGVLADDCLWSESVTPGKENKVEKINHPPNVDFDCPEIGEAGVPVRFNSSDTIDEDNDSLSFDWNFGDGFVNSLAHPEHTYLNGGEYKISLSVSDGEFVESVEKKIIISGINFNDNLEYKIIISEFMPNPAGADADGEWIEIYNEGSTRVNIRNWRLDDNEGGSRPFDLKEDYWLDPGAYFLFDREETGLALNNTVDAVRLLNRAGEVVDFVEYRDVSENASMARANDGEWQWSLESTPGEANVIKIASSPVGARTVSAPKKVKYMTDVPLEKAREFDKGDLVRTRGTVAVLPGIFGSQYFYITGSPGIQVYNYKKDFPVLSLGDYIEVSGEISESYGEKRIKTSIADDMKILERLEEPQARVCACEDIGEASVGELVSINGEVVERKSSNIYLDDGTDERLVYIKTGTGISASSYKEGDKLTVTGIVAKTQSGVRVQPRSSADIVRNDYEENGGRVMGEISEEAEWDLAARDKNQKIYQYLLIIFGTVILVFGVLIYRLIVKK
jgi:PKD repeat protein